MRTIQIDYYEFDCRNSEEMLTLIVAPRGQYPDLAAFVAAARGLTEDQRVPGNGPLQPFAESGRRGEWVREYLKQFAGVEISRRDSQVLTLCEDWNDVELIITDSRHYIWYSWMTGA